MSQAKMPTDASKGLGFFDRFATRASTFVSKAWFFSLCLLMVLIWAPSIVVIKNVDTWQLVINTATTIVTFLLVALLQNTQSRTDAATQQKLNAIAEALADFMGELAESHPKLNSHRDELCEAIGLEKRESS
jgi:low affinity Fe/Cu permease